MKFAIFFALIAAMAGVSSACLCMVRPRPSQECQTEYLMFVKITGASVDSVNMRRTYSFELIQDISYPAPYINTFTEIETGYDSGTCLLHLEVGKYYLLGGSVRLPANANENGILYAGSCDYVREWQSKPCSSETYAELSEIYKNCYKYRQGPIAQTISGPVRIP